jgi:NAD(P)-dependent dehydrogenase (short-subunit alcohol dehydrogenase family)
MDRDSLNGLKGQVAVVTGAGQGIAAAVAAAMAAAGVQVAVCDINASAAFQVAASSVQGGGSAFGVPLDVGESASIAAAATAAAQRLGSTFIWVNKPGSAGRRCCTRCPRTTSTM